MKLRRINYQEILTDAWGKEIEEAIEKLQGTYLLHKQQNPDFVSLLVEEMSHYRYQPRHGQNYYFGDEDHKLHLSNLNRAVTYFANENREISSESDEPIRNRQSKKYGNNGIEKIKWRGTKKQFAILMKVLMDREWIELEKGQVGTAADILYNCFDFSNTEEKKETGLRQAFRLFSAEKVETKTIIFSSIRKNSNKY